MWLDHGYQPVDAAYQYVVVPNVEVSDLADRVSPIEILANTPTIQAVRHSGLGMVQAIFYKGGEVQVTDDLVIRADTQATVMVKMEGDRINELSVSDPSRKCSRSTLTVSGNYDATGEGFSTFPTDDHTVILVDLPQDVYAGKSVTVQL